MFDARISNVETEFSIITFPTTEPMAVKEQQTKNGKIAKPKQKKKQKEKHTQNKSEDDEDKNSSSTKREAPSASPLP